MRKKYAKIEKEAKKKKMVKASEAGVDTPPPADAVVPKKKKAKNVAVTESEMAAIRPPDATESERKVWEMVCDGYSIYGVASKLNLSGAKVYNILKKNCNEMRRQYKDTEVARSVLIGQLYALYTLMSQLIQNPKTRDMTAVQAARCMTAIIDKVSRLLGLDQLHVTLTDTSIDNVTLLNQLNITDIMAKDEEEQ